MVLASEDDFLSVVELLIEYGYDVDIADKCGWTPLMAAAACGRGDIVKYLCGKGARVNLKEQNGKTALHLAAQAGHSEAFQIIVEYGGNKDLRCNKDKTPFDYAVEAEKLKELEELKLLRPQDRIRCQLKKGNRIINAIFSRIG